MKRTWFLTAMVLAWTALDSGAARADDTMVCQGKAGPGFGKHIVFLSGDEEYRSEEALPMLARILAERHGFTCTVVFALNPADGTITPTVRTNLPGIEALDTADLCVVLLRHRELPDTQMKHFVDYLQRGKPIVALRTSTHAFTFAPNAKSSYSQFDAHSSVWPGGFGQQVLGETWVNHHGEHGRQSTRGILDAAQASHPVLRGVQDIWGPSDVYSVVHLPTNATVLVWGQVLAGMKPGDPPLPGSKNNPMMPVAWIRDYRTSPGATSRIFTTTMGAAVDLKNEGLRRLVVNACYWAVGLADRIPGKTDVDYVGEYHPSWFGFGKEKHGVKPSDLN